MTPSRTQLVAAIETLTAAELLDVSPRTARDIMRGLPGSVMLPGGDLRCRAQELERWLDQHPAEVRSVISRG